MKKSSSEVGDLLQDPPQSEVSEASRAENLSSTPSTGEVATRHDVHVVLGSKGGTGKSFCCWMIAQWLTSPLIYDTDPNNPTLHSFKGLGAEYVPALHGEAMAFAADDIDRMIETIALSRKPVVIDVGSSGFIPMASYLLGDDVSSLLSEHGHRLVLHTTVVGGQAQADCVNGAVALLSQFPGDVPIIVWENHYDHVVADLDFGGGRQPVKGTLYRLAQLHRDVLGAILKNEQTFSEALDDPAMTLSQRSRLRQIRSRLFDQLDLVMASV
jgi:hypothetical protein